MGGCCCNCHRVNLSELGEKLPPQQRQRIRMFEGLETWVYDLLMVSAETGSIEILEEMAQAHLWSPSTFNDVVWGVPSKSLLKLLQHFQAPLGAINDLQISEVLQVLCNTEEEEEDEDSPQEFRRNSRKVAKAVNGIIKPTPQAMLLANLIMVPNLMAQQGKGSVLALDGIVENMIVFQPEDCCKTQIIQIIPDGYRDPLHRVTQISTEHSRMWSNDIVAPPSVPKKQAFFPDGMGEIYLVGKAVERASFRKERRELWDWPHRGDVTRTSPVFALEATETTILGVPRNVKGFAFFFGDPGGFVYVDQEDQILAIHLISFVFRGCVVCFGSPQTLSQEACDVLKQAKRWSDVTAQPLLDKGAVKYTFVGPAEELGDDFIAEYKGGFCYLFDNGYEPCYFPILSSGLVMNRAVLPLFSPNAAILPRNADGRDVQKIVYAKHNFPCAKRQQKELAKFARLTVPGITHPVVLRSLVNTPWPPVLSTIAAQALTQTAFDEHIYEIVFDIIEEVLSLLAITGITLQVRRDDMVGLSGPMLTLMHCELVVIAVVSVKNISDEIFKFLGCYSQGWPSDYAGLGTWIGLMGMLSSFAWIEAGLFYGFAPTFHLRALMAVNGAMNWMRVLYALRGTIVFRLGPRILPILSALCDITDFVLIMMFFMGAGAHVFFALSDSSTSLGSILFSTYRLGFLAEYEIPDDVFFVGEDEEYFSWSSIQYVAFIIFSFVVSISLTNIFIGVMSNSFDSHSDKVEELLQRTRASIALGYALRDVGRKKFLGRSLRGLQILWISPGNRLWFCYRHLGEARGTAENGTLRGSINASRDALAKRLEESSQRMGAVEEMLINLLDTAHRPSRVPEVSPGDPTSKFMADFSRLEGEVRELQASEARRGDALQKSLEDLNQKVQALAAGPGASAVASGPEASSGCQPGEEEGVDRSRALDGLSSSGGGSDAGDGEGSLPPLPTLSGLPQEEAPALPIQAVHSLKGASCHEVFPSTPTTPTPPVMLLAKGATYHDVFGKPDPNLSPPAPKRVVVKKAKRRRSKKYDED